MRLVRKNYQKASFEKPKSMKNFIIREENPLDEFHSETIICDDDGKEATSYCNPIVMLFNQIRLNNLDPTSLRQWIEGQPQDSALQNLMSKVDPQDIIATIKSRHLQSPCEIKAWAQYMDSSYSDLNTAIEEALAEQKKSVAAPVDVQPQTSE